MGKKGGHSWLTAVKRAFRSPTKDSQKKTTRRREEYDQEEEEEKKREKRRWLFRKPSNNNANAPQNESKVITCPAPPPKTPELPPEQRNAIAVAAATAAAAQAAVEIIRITRSSNPSSVVKQNHAATLIQTSFRGYLARRALVALKGIVKLQALIRGQNVRKQAKLTLKCMQALLRVQARVRDQQARLSQDGGRRSMFAETNNLWDCRYLRDIRDRKSMSKDRSFNADEWSDHCPRTLEDLEAALQARKEAALKRETSLAYAFSHQIWDYDSGYEKEVEERTNWLDKWMATKQWDSCSRASTDKRDSIKTVEVDVNAAKQYSHSAMSARKNQYLSSHHHKQANPPQSAASPRHRSLQHSTINFSTLQPPLTPSPSKSRPVHIRSCSPRCIKEEKSYSTANTPSSRSIQRINTSICRYSISANEGAVGINGTMPNYMAATESAKARVRSQSAPRQRSSTPERERGGGFAKKRLSFPVPEQIYCTRNTAAYGYTSSFSQNLRSPSFKSVQAGYVGMEQQSNQSCYTDSIGGEISPCSTTDLRRWLR